jgi:hypothetical protein
LNIEQHKGTATIKIVTSDIKEMSFCSSSPHPDWLLGLHAASWVGTEGNIAHFVGGTAAFTFKTIQNAKFGILDQWLYVSSSSSFFFFS